MTNLTPIDAAVLELLHWPLTTPSVSEVEPQALSH